MRTDVDGHRAHAGVVVCEGEAGRLAADRERERQAERRKLTPEFPFAAFGEDERVLAEHAERAGGMPRAAADLRCGARDDVTREMPDYADRPHGREA